MSKNNTFETELLQLIFNNSNLANVGDATGLRGSSVAGSLYWALHSAWPGEAGDQTTSEVSYTGYGRVAAARSGAGFTVSGNQVVPAATVSFGPCTAGSASARFWSLGVASAGASKTLYQGVIGAAAKVFTAATDDNIKAPGHGLAVNDEVCFFPIAGIALPTGITEGTVYFVKTAPDADTITISTTAGGSTLDITAVGAGLLHKIQKIDISSGVTPQLTTSSVITED